MKKIYLILSLLAVPAAYGQTETVNFVRSISYPNGYQSTGVTGLSGNELPNNTSLVSIGYFNGWAQEIQSQTLSDRTGYVLQSRKYYDARGRLMLSGKAQEFSVTDSLNYRPKNMSQYLTESATYDSAFERLIYFNEIQDRIRFKMPYGSVYHNTTRAIKFEYGYDTTLNAMRTRSIDEDGQVQDVYTDVRGSKIRQATRMDIPANDLITVFEYDGLGRLLESSPPLGVKNAQTSVWHGEAILQPGTAMRAMGEAPSQLRLDTILHQAVDDPASTPLLYSKPVRSLTAEAVLSLTEGAGGGQSIHSDEQSTRRFEDAQLGYNLVLEYQIYEGNMSGPWKTVVNLPMTIRLSREQTALKVRRKELTLSGFTGTLTMKLDGTASSIDSAKYTTVYKYDPRGSLIEKRSPDEGKTVYVYDGAGRLRFVQDENHRNNFYFNGQRCYWTYYKYDGLGRMTEQGELTADKSASELTDKALFNYTSQLMQFTYCDTIRQAVNCRTVDTLICMLDAKAKSGDENSAIRFDNSNCNWVTIQVTYCDTIKVPTNCRTIDSTVSAITVYGPNSYPTASDNPLKTVVNQYDLYGSAGWNINPGPDSVNTGANPVNFPKTRLTRTKILDANTSPNTWSEECYTYDKYGRVTTRRVHIPELAQSKKFQYYYDASGRVLKTMYQDGVAAESFYQWFKYDNLSRLDSVFSSRTNNRATAVREAAYDYDNNHGGKILTTKLGNNIQQVDYTYNSRDWLKYINDVNNIGTDKFALSLGYDTVGTNPRFNGNIAASASLVAGQAQYAYNYVYDKANRLTDANYSGNLFSEKSIGYDANGNITALTRHLNSASATPITYAYDAAKPNQLKYVTGALADSFYYDANGNMTRDKLKGNFDYDYRNMPVKMYLNSGKIIKFAYDAGGQRIKLLRRSAVGDTLLDSSRVYILNGGKVTAEYIYKRSTQTWSIDHYNIYGNELIGKVALIPATSGTVIKTGQINTSQTADSLNLQSSQIQSGGSVTLLAKNGIRVQSTFNSNGATVSLRPGVSAAGSGATGGFTDVRYYYLSDHLGSVRVTLKEDGSIDSWSDYYPFGKESRSSASVNKPRENFTGHQLDAESSLIYAGARYYNQDIGRWNSVDPAAEYSSPYCYVGNNPVNLIDPKGLSSVPAGCTAITEFNNRISNWQNGISYSWQAGDGGTPGGNGNQSNQQNNQENVPPVGTDIVQNYGNPAPYLKSGYHYGIDQSGKTKFGDKIPIVAVASGKVEMAIDNFSDDHNTWGMDPQPPGESRGNYVIIDHGDGIKSTYMHMTQQVMVSTGQVITRGEIIGYMGNTGQSEARHLHFHLERNGVRMNPVDFIPAYRDVSGYQDLSGYPPPK